MLPVPRKVLCLLRSKSRMQQINFEDGVTKILRKDSRYAREGYEFLREALEFTQKAYSKSAKSVKFREIKALPEEFRKELIVPTDSHITGQELLSGIREYALAMFGPMTMTVFEQWGISRCEDFGNMVFLMVDNGLLRKTDKDNLDDFKGGYSFEQAFREPFMPLKNKAGSAPPQTAAREVEKN